MADRISVIIPVYNTGDRLSRCLDSMLAQSVRDLEIIAVNDGSTDNSPAICDEYARKDSRVKAIHMANGGVSAARNRGLEEATGTFVCFIDSDDWCEPWYIETFLSGMDDGVDLVLQGPQGRPPRAEMRQHKRRQGQQHGQSTQETHGFLPRLKWKGRRAARSPEL